MVKKSKLITFALSSILALSKTASAQTYLDKKYDSEKEQYELVNNHIDKFKKAKTLEDMFLYTKVININQEESPRIDSTVFISISQKQNQFLNTFVALYVDSLTHKTFTDMGMNGLYAGQNGDFYEIYSPFVNTSLYEMNHLTERPSARNDKLNLEFGKVMHLINKSLNKYDKKKNKK